MYVINGSLDLVNKLWYFSQALIRINNLMTCNSDLSWKRFLSKVTYEMLTSAVSLSLDITAVVDSRNCFVCNPRVYSLYRKHITMWVREAADSVRNFLTHLGDEKNPPAEHIYISKNSKLPSFITFLKLHFIEKIR